MNKVYIEEVQKKYGKTVAYQEFKEKTKNYQEEKWKILTKGLNNIFFNFAELMKSNYLFNSNETQKLVYDLKNYISQNYYTCTNDILLKLGELYETDERFLRNIDKHGAGTANYIKKAIAFFYMNDLEVIKNDE